MSSVVGAVLPVALSVLVGGLAMAWRLGRLEQKVKDVKEDVEELRQWYRTDWKRRP